MNPWESNALDYRFAEQGNNDGTQATQSIAAAAPGTNDSLIYPGLYCPSGLDVMSVLLRVFARPNPTIDLGPVDSSVALVVCDLAVPDTPIVYASDPFLDLTGYRMGEVLGRNCRFLQQQAPGAAAWSSYLKQPDDRRRIQRMREAIRTNTEHQTEIVNFKKDGRPFVNIVTVIPITWDGDNYRYSVGFQCQKE